MKKFLKMLLAATMVLGLTACGGKKDDEGEKVRIALILPYFGDQSYFDVTKQGIELAQEKYGDKIETQCIEMGTDEAGWTSAYTQACEDGYDVIISGNFQYEAYMLQAAKEHPEITFINFDYSDAEANKLDNVYGVAYKCQENGYLAGIVAAVKSETGVVGAIGGMEIGGIKQFLGGFIEGAKLVNPDIKIKYAFVGDFQDTAKAKEIAQNMHKAGADVIWHAAGGAGNGLFEAASEDGFWAIGVDTDQRAVFSEKPEIADHILTSSMKNCDQVVLRAIGQYLDGTLALGTLETLGYAENAVGLAENDYYKANLTEDQLAKVKEYQDKLLNGEVTLRDCQAEETAWADLTKGLE